MFKDLINNQYRISMFILIAIISIVIIYNIFMIQINGDEAYYISWGKVDSHLYYDHPPLIGYLSAMLTKISDRVEFQRLTSFIFYILSIVVFHRYQVKIKKIEKNWRDLISVGLFFSPIQLFLSTVFFNHSFMVSSSIMYMSLLFFSLDNTSKKHALFAGFFLGVSLLFNFLGLLNYLSLALLYLANKKKQKFIWYCLLSSIPACLYLLFINFENCYTNFSYYLLTRWVSNETDPGGMKNLSLFIFLISPAIVYFLKYYHELGARKLTSLTRENLFTVMFTLKPFLILIVLCFFVKVTFIYFALPLTYFWFWLNRQSNTTKRSITSLTLSNVFLSLSLLLFYGYSSKSALLDGKVRYEFVNYGEDIIQKLDLEKYDYIFTNDYNTASILEYHLTTKKINTLEFLFEQGRSYDFRNDFSRFDGKPIHIVVSDLTSFTSYEKYFSEFKVKEYKSERVTIFLITGFNFKFSEFKHEIIEPKLRTFYPFAKYSKSCRPLDVYNIDY